MHSLGCWVLVQKTVKEDPSPCPRHPSVLDILVGPLEHLGEDVQDRLSASVAVRLVRQQDQPSRPAVALDRLEKPIGLNREGSRVVVGLTMDQQQGGFDLVGVRERRHFHVKLGCLPERPPLGLESEGRKSPVVSAGAGDAGGEKVGVGEQVGRHEGPVAVPGDADPFGVDHPSGIERLDGGFCRGGDLLDICVVHRVRAADNRHRRVHQDGISLRKEETGVVSL